MTLKSNSRKLQRHSHLTSNTCAYVGRRVQAIPDILNLLCNLLLLSPYISGVHNKHICLLYTHDMYVHNP